MKTLIVSLAAALALAAPGVAQAHTLHHAPFRSMSLVQLRHYQLRAVAHANGVIAFYRNHHHVKPSHGRRLEGFHPPRVVWWHQRQLGWLHRELAQTNAALSRQRHRQHRWHAATTFGPSSPYARPAVDGCLSQLIQRESGWNVHATNSSSGAYGLPQALPGSKMASAGPDWHDNPTTQIRWMLGYVEQYGGSCGALSFQIAHGWY